MLLALLALGLPTVALATSVDFSSGGFKSGTFSGSFTTSINFSVTGDEHTIDITTGTLTATSCAVSGEKCFKFSGGNVTVDSTLFTDTLTGGTITDKNGSVSISADLSADSMVAHGSVTGDFELQGTKITGGSGDVSFTSTSSTVPEPSTLGLLGTGLIGLAWMAKRKLKLPI